MTTRSESLPPGPPPRKAGLRSLPYYARMLRDPLGTIEARFERYGDMYCAPNPDGFLYVLRHPDHIHEVLVSKASSFGKGHTAMEQLSQVIGDGLVVTDGELWRRHRRMIQPSFSRARLEGYAELMTEEASAAADRLVIGKQLDVSAAMTELTMRVVCRTLFNHALSGEQDRIASAVETLFKDAARPDLTPAWLPSMRRRRMGAASGQVDAFIRGLYEDRRAEKEGEYDGPVDLLRALVGAVDEEGDGKGLTAREVRDELLTFFFAGHETTSHALTWTLYLLSRHPEIERAVVDEIQSALGEREPAYDDLAAMPLVEQVFSEAMRLYPPAYALARVALEDTEIGGYEVGAGSEVMCWTLFAQRDGRWFDDPLDFKPERFGKEADAPRKGAYIPFGAGPRMCIGKRFSLIEAQLVLATLLRRFRFESLDTSEPELGLGVTLRPKGGLPMVVWAR